jgi:hypothetical protein
MIFQKTIFFVSNPLYIIYYCFSFFSFLSLLIRSKGINGPGRIIIIFLFFLSDLFRLNLDQKIFDMVQRDWALSRS